MEATAAAARLTKLTIVRPYAVDAVMINPAKLRHAGVASDPRDRHPSSFVVVAWGSTPAHATASRRRADDFAYDNYLRVVEHVVSHCPKVRDAELYDVASASAVYRSATYDMVWWLLDAKRG